MTRYPRDSGDKFALKVMSKSKYIKMKATSLLVQEIDAHCKCRKSPFIASVVATATCPKRVYVLMELLLGDDFFNYVYYRNNYKANGGRFPQSHG